MSTKILDGLRNIGKEIVSFISIIIISMLAITSYLGINFGAMALQKNADKFYDKLSFRDIEITSTKLFSESDIADLAAQDVVADVEGVKVQSCNAVASGKKKSVSVITLTERINKPDVLEGELPKNADECAVEEEIMDKLKLSVGDTISMENSTGEKPKYLAVTEFKITAKVHHPDNYAHEKNVPGNRYVLVLNDAFDNEELQNSYMKAIVKVKGTEEFDYFSGKYKDKVNEAIEELRPFADEHQLARENFIKDEYGKKLEEGKEELDDGKAELDEGKAELDKNAQKISDGEQKLADGKKKLDEADQKIKDGEEKLNSSDKKLKDAKAELDSSKKKLDNAEKELADGKTKLEEEKVKLDDAQKELSDGKLRLDDASKELVDSFNDVESYKNYARMYFSYKIGEVIGDEAANALGWCDQTSISSVDDPNLFIRPFQVTNSYMTTLSESTPYNTFISNVVHGVLSGSGYEDKANEIYNNILSDGDFSSQYYEYMPKLKEWDDGHDEYLTKLGEYNDGQAKYDSGLSEYNAACEKYDAGVAEYEAGKAKYEAGLAEYEDGLAKYEEGKKELDDGKSEYDEKSAEYEKGKADLENGKKEYADGQKKYDDGVEKYNESLEEYEAAEEQYASIGKCYWIMVGVEGNGGYYHAESYSKNIDKIGKTFSLLFVIIGALVIYVTVGRLIKEQRRLVGVQKALGFLNKEVLTKYLTFGISGTILGAILGTTLGYFLIQWIVLDTHKTFYVTGAIPKTFSLLWSLIILAAGIAIAAIAVIIACSSLTKKPARELMKDEVQKPKKKKKKYKKKDKDSSVYGKLIISNMLSDLSRVIITIISVAGCTALLVIGFTIKNSVNDSIDLQYDKLIKYSNEVVFDPSASETVEAEMTEKLNSAGMEYVSCYTAYHTTKTKDGLSLSTIICGDQSELEKAIEINDVKGKNKIEIADHGIYMTRAISEEYDYELGDKIIIYDDEMNPYEVEVAGFFEQYFNKEMILTRKAYKEVFGKDCVNNTFFINSKVDSKELKDMLSSVKGYRKIVTTEKEKKDATGTASVLSLITTILIIIAGIMSYFIIMNLINMYLNQKKKELVIMRINGYTTKEVIKYVSYENILTTVLGMIVGIGIGSLVTYIIILLLQNPALGLKRTVDPIGWLISCLITAAFTIVVSAIALRKVKHLKLSDTK